MTIQGFVCSILLVYTVVLPASAGVYLALPVYMRWLETVEDDFSALQSKFELIQQPSSASLKAQAALEWKFCTPITQSSDPMSKTFTQPLQLDLHHNMITD